MTADTHPMNPHVALHGERLRLAERFFGVFGGPAAWFIQLCAGYGLASQPCFVNGAWVAQLPANSHWTWLAMVILMIAAAVVALLAFLVSWRAFKRTQHEVRGNEVHLMETATGRARFLALWGILLGLGFAVASALTAVAFATLPRCAG
jgi:hypothetical protein